jgi:hypothetical protein
LKACPFCGGDAEIDQFGDGRKSTIYSCTECGCRLETSETFAHGTLWNRRTLDAAPADQKEWKLVPIEPTDDMLIVGQEAWAKSRSTRPAIEDCEEASCTYRAMVKAAPSDPADPVVSAECWRRAIADIFGGDMIATVELHAIELAKDNMHGT